MASKALTIQKAGEEICNKFHENRAKLNLSPPAYLSLLLNTEPNQNNSNTDVLEAEINQLKQNLKESEEKNNALQAENQSLIQNSNGIKISFPQFVCSPSIDLASKIKRSAIYDIKKNKISKEDFLNQFTVNALNYYIKNEYSHILK